MRSYHDPVEVRVRPRCAASASAGSATGWDEATPWGDADPAGAPPEMFLWRGRLYLITEVLDHWRIRSDWWRAALRSLDREAGAEGGQGLEGAGGVEPERAGSLRAVVTAAERTVWRVSAAAGRGGSVGTYDLAHDPFGAGGWVLLRVAD
ncbi:DUF6504 family protein [Dermacoccaceae bacterium W4C1]